MKRFISSIIAFIFVICTFTSIPVMSSAEGVDALTFRRGDGDFYCVASCDALVTGEVVIPDTYKGLPVSVIEDFAFKDCKNITHVKIPDSITSIGEGAFLNCSGLTSVDFEENKIKSKYVSQLVNDCQNISHWNTYSTSNCEADTEDYVLGSQSIHSVNGSMVCLRDTYDMRNNNLVLKIKINSISAGSALRLQVLNTSNWSKSVVYDLMKGASTTPVGEWREITVPYTGYIWGSVDNFDFSNINFIRLYAVGDVDWNLQYTALEPVEKRNSIVTFTFDDGYASQYTGLEILAQKGIPGTLYYVPEANTNGSPDYLKVKDLQELVDKFNTDVEVHGKSSYNDMTDEELKEHWELTQKLLKENGISEGRHMSYPNGMHDNRVVNLARRYFDSCRTIQYYIPGETLPPADAYRIRSISSIGESCNKVSFVKDKINKAVESDSWLILVFHKIGDVTGDTMYCSAEDLSEIADYVNNTGAEVLTMADAIDKIYGKRLSIGKEAFASCENLKSVNLPSDVNIIDENAFGYYKNDDGSFEKINEFALKGAKNSATEFYAQDNSFTFSEICGHNLEKNYIVNRSTCIRHGIRCHECVLCGKKVNEELPLSSHNYSPDWLVDTHSTCTEDGIKSKHCSNCDSRVDVDSIPATGHEVSQWIISKKATVNSAGSKYQKCNICGVKLKTAKIPQLKCATPKLKNVVNVATGIKFTWNKVTGADNYEIYRKIGKNAWKKIATVKGTVITYTDKTAKSGTTYKYTVKAKNEAGLSGYNTTGLTIKCLISPVLKAPTSTKNSVTLKWSKATGAEGYVVYRKTGNGKFTKIATVKGASKLSYTDKSVKKGTKYTYKLKAYSGKTYSVCSNAETIKSKN